MMIDKTTGIFVEFIGLGASGKTTLCDSVIEALAEKGVKNVLSADEFKRYKIFFKWLLVMASMLADIKKLYLVVRFFVKNRRALHHTNESEYTPYKEIWKTFRKVVTAIYIFKANKIKYFLADQFVLYPLILFNQEIAVDFTGVWDLYPDGRICYVFVDTPPEVAEERKRSREQDPIKRKIVDDRKDLSRAAKSYKRLKDTYSFLKQYEGKTAICKVIILDGRLSVAKNTQIIMDELSAIDING